MEKYCSLSLVNLRNKLKKRHAKVSGRKKELIERLEAYERNFNFGKCDNPVPPEYVMKLPDAMVYKDLNSDRKFAKVEIDDLILYLGLFEKKLDQTPINLYKSSNFGRICKLTALEIIDPKVFKSKATEYGKRYEKNAIKEYERETECSVTDCGIFVSKHLPFLGSSPDGVVSDKLIVEVKCPFSARDKTVSASTVPYLTVTDDILHLNHNHNYYYQVQGQLYCSNRLYCDFIVYTLCDSKCFCIMKDDASIAQMLSKQHEFYTRYFKPAILKKFFYKEV